MARDPGGETRLEIMDLREQGQFGRPMGDPQQRAVRRALQHRLEHGVGRGAVKVAGGFVEKENRTLHPADNSPRARARGGLGT